MEIRTFKYATASIREADVSVSEHDECTELRREARAAIGVGFWPTNATLEGFVPNVDIGADAGVVAARVTVDPHTWELRGSVYQNGLYLAVELGIGPVGIEVSLYGG